MHLSHIFHLGSVILLENLRFHVEEEGKGTDTEGKKVNELFMSNPLNNWGVCVCVGVGGGGFLGHWNS